MKSSRHSRTSLLLCCALVLAGAIPLAGCSSDGGDWINLYKASIAAWEDRDAPVSLDQAAAIPYATLGVRLDGGKEQMLLLAVDTDGEQLWTSSARVAIATRAGRIVKTAGFSTDLMAHSSRETGEDWRRPHTYSWSGDFGDLGFYSVPIICYVRPAGHEPITILGKTLNTFRVDETCRSEAMNWSFSNNYWVSADSGRVWRSLQHIHPNGPTLEIEILRPPLGFQ
jgi:hypothetical protein